MRPSSCGSQVAPSSCGRRVAAVKLRPSSCCRRVADVELSSTTSNSVGSLQLTAMSTTALDLQDLAWMTASISKMMPYCKHYYCHQQSPTIFRQAYLDLTLTYSKVNLAGGAVCRFKYSVASKVYAAGKYSGFIHTYTAGLSMLKFQTSGHLRYDLGTLCPKVLSWDHHFFHTVRWRPR